jgi:hypothetical protein
MFVYIRCTRAHAHAYMYVYVSILFRDHFFAPGACFHPVICELRLHMYVCNGCMSPLYI